MRSLGKFLRRSIHLLMMVVMLMMPMTPASADLRTGPSWWDPGAVGAGEDWHYRVPVTIAAGNYVNATVKVDVNFATLLSQMGVSGTFDANSVRVVRSTGALATEQEYTDAVFADATDATGNSRGEVRFILQDNGPITYYIYFDITANGTKAANPQTPINGNFEVGASGTQIPTGWATAVKSNAVYDMQIRPSETVSVTSDGSPLNNPYNTNGTPNTGAQSYMLGARSNNEPATGGSQADATMLTRTIKVPATNPGSLTIRWRPEGWDSDANTTTTYDNIHIRLVSATSVVTEIVGPATAAYTTWPFSPNFPATAASASASGYGQYNGYDMTTGGTHRSGMTVAFHGEPWWSRTYSLAAYAGTTITLRIGTTHYQAYRSWFHIDDIEWAVVTGTLGTPEGFGTNVTAPLAAATLAPGQTLAITAQVDARPTTMTANVYNNTGALVASGVDLFNDGTHGDVTAGDAIWSNDGSDTGSPTYTIPLSTLTTTGWIVRVFANDSSTSTIGVANGLIDIPPAATAAETQTNFYNIDEITFGVGRANITVDKSSSIVSDPRNGTLNPKFIPGGTVRYCILISNGGTAVATSLVATDPMPGTVTYTPGSMKSGTACATAATVEDDDAAGADDTDTVGASYASGVVTITVPTLGAGSAIAVLIDAIIN